MISLPTRIKVQKKGEMTPSWMPLHQFENFFGIIYRPSIVFPSHEALKTVSENCPYILRYKWIASDNYAWDKINREKTPPIYIKWIDDTMGYGVFADNDIEKDAFIGEYAGVVRRLYRNHPDHNAYCFHYPTKLWSLNYYTIDAKNQGNITRFINHSDQPNLQPLCLIDKNKILHLMLVAKCTIPKDTQLVFDYGPDFWARRKKA